MKLLKTIGLETKGPYCFYCVSPDSAVLVGIKRQRNGKLIVPERIGKFTVRGVDEPLSNGRIYDAYASLSQKEKDKVRERLSKYAKLSSVPFEKLPFTIEYIGDFINLEGPQELRVPDNIRYIGVFSVPRSVPITIVFPNTLHYLKLLLGRTISSVRFEGEKALLPPHHSLSVYLGREVEEIPQIGEEAFRHCVSLEKLVLGDHFVKIGAKAMPSSVKPSVGYYPLHYELHIPKQLQSVEINEFHNAYIDKLIYPDDLSETLCRKRINVCEIQHLIIHDIGELKQYAFYQSHGAEPDEYPEKCLYHLMRCARHIYFTKPLDEIFDSMFEGCGKLLSITVGSEETNTYLRGFQLPREIKSIGNRAFADCCLLKPIRFNVGTHIGDNAFLNCEEIQHKAAEEKKISQTPKHVEALPKMKPIIPAFPVEPVSPDLGIFDFPFIPSYDPSAFSYESSTSSYDSSEFSYEPMMDEDDRILSEIASDSRGDIAYSGTGSYTATDIEDEWSDLDSLGFWDDKSWQ